jgi:hypothetical protein
VGGRSVHRVTTHYRRRAMLKKGDTMQAKWLVVLTMGSLILLWSLSVPSVARAQQPNNICVLQIVAEGEVLSIVTDQPQNFNIAVLVPPGKSTNVPVTCDLLSTLSLAVSNQKNKNINVVAQVFTNDGVLICSKGPYLLSVNGGRGITFADCQ